MRYQLRDYRVLPGRLDDFVALWKSQVVPLRERMGFTVAGAWCSPETNRFVWVVGYDGDFEAADAAYYASPERRRVSPDPADLLDQTSAEFVTSVV